MEEAGFALTRCVWWLTSTLLIRARVCVCVRALRQGVLPFRSSIIHRQTSFRLYHENLSGGGTWGSKVLIDDGAGAAAGTGKKKHVAAKKKKFGKHT